MQHFIPDQRIFKPQEIFPPHIIKQHLREGDWIDPQIWRLMDSRVLWTAEQLRKLFGPMIVNDYMWGGVFDDRGYRDPMTLIDHAYYKESGEIRASWSSFTSQHCSGRALDSSFKNILAVDVRSYIISNQNKEEFKYITAIEKEVSWFHFDVRNFKAGDARFFLF